MQPSTVCRARLARAVRVDQPADVIEDLRRDYHAARTRDVLVTWLASDPAPTAAHRAELAALLVEGGADAAA